MQRLRARLGAQFKRGKWGWVRALGFWNFGFFWGGEREDKGILMSIKVKRERSLFK